MVCTWVLKSGAVAIGLQDPGRALWTGAGEQLQRGSAADARVVLTHALLPVLLLGGGVLLPVLLLPAALKLAGGPSHRLDLLAHAPLQQRG